MVVGQCAKLLALLTDLHTWPYQAFHAISGWDLELLLATEVLPLGLCEIPPTPTRGKAFCKGPIDDGLETLYCRQPGEQEMPTGSSTRP